MNRADRRAASRAFRRDGFLISEPVTACVCDGYPCPFCSEITAPDEHGVWRCLCGLSAVLVRD